MLRGPARSIFEQVVQQEPEGNAPPAQLNRQRCEQSRVEPGFKQRFNMRQLHLGAADSLVDMQYFSNFFNRESVFSNTYRKNLATLNVRTLPVNARDVAVVGGHRF